MKFPPIGSLVAVEWLDAWIDYGESKASSWGRECRVTTYGVLMRAGDVVTIASERMPQDEFRSVTHVPRKMVERITRLK